MAAKLLVLAKKWKERHRGICVITHTNVARNEIITRLHGHPSGFKLTGYPHFIGTIQEFVNRYLGLPFCRSNGFPINRIDDEVCAHAIERSIGRGTKIYLDRSHASVYDLRLKYENDDLLLTVPGFADESTSNSYKDMERAKWALLQGGLYFYSEMYAFAKKLLSDNPDLTKAIRQRFPVVLIDEMQDTQKYQDVILQQLFDNESICLQRFGDPDQAIFDNIGGDEPNESYNGKSDLYEIQTTHRFGLDICEKIIGLSYNSLENLSSARDPNREENPHTLFIYDDNSQGSVLGAFGYLLAQVDTGGQWNCVKAVGGVDGETGQIRKYWQGYDKGKTVTSPNPKNLIRIVRACSGMSDGHVAINYNRLLQGVVDFLRKANVRIENKDGTRVYFSQQTLTQRLKEEDKYTRFRQLIALWITGNDIDEDRWGELTEELTVILDVSVLNGEATDYLAYEAVTDQGSEEHASVVNVYACDNGRTIEVGTIHSVKGEPHDATLILETKFNRWFDD